MEGILLFLECLWGNVSQSSWNKPNHSGKRPLAAALFEDFGAFASFSGALPPWGVAVICSVYVAVVRTVG